MTDTQNPESRTPAERTASPASNATRRKLLKASLAAPLVSSLQVSSAYANASAYQCVQENETNQPTQDSRSLAQGADGWVRVPLWRYRFKNPANDNLIWLWDVPPSGSTGLDGSDPSATTGYTLYRQNNGNPIDPVARGWVYQNEKEQRLALVLYQPTSDYLHVDEVGPFPRFQRDEGEGIALTGTCLCSATNQTATFCNLG